MTKEPRWLASAARRATSESWTLGGLFAQYCSVENATDVEIANEVNCDIGTLRWLYLCRAPSSARFAQDVERIAQRFALDGNRLAALVRRVEALAALRAPTHDAGESELLLAARDREDGEELQ